MNQPLLRAKLWVGIVLTGFLLAILLHWFPNQKAFGQDTVSISDVNGLYPSSLSINAPFNYKINLPTLFKAGVSEGVPQYPADYSKDVETWWAGHPYNPASPNYIPVGAIQSPQPVINVKTDYNGDIQAAVDALPATGGTLYFPAGTYDSFTIIAKSNVHFIGENQNTVFIRGGYIFGCPMSVSYRELDLQLSQNNPTALDCLRNRYHNYYFKNITFDGHNLTVGTNNQTPINEALYFRAVKDVLMENITIQNYGSPPNDDWGGVCENCANIVSHAWVDNIFCRNCVFRAYALNAWYMDGSHGSGVINSLFDGNWRSTALLNLVNHDFSEDLNRDGVLELDEQKVPMYTVYYGNTFTKFNYLAFTIQGARSLIKNNQYLADVHKFAFFEVRDDLPEYQYLGNVVAGNFVKMPSLFVINGGGSTTNRQGQYTVKDNTIVSFGNLSVDEQGENQFIQDFPVVIGPNTVYNNCVVGVLDGKTSCSVAPPPTPTPVPTSSFTPAPLPTPTPSPTLPPGSNVIIGHQTIGSLTDTADSNYINGSRFNVGANGGTVTSLSVYVAGVDTAPNNQYQMALYTDNNGVPGSLLAHTNTGILTANSWNTIPINATLNPNVSFWIMYNTNGSSPAFNDMRYDLVGGSQSAFGTNGMSFGSWPQNFGPATPQNFVFSVYATLSTSISPVITPVPGETQGYFPLGVFEDATTLGDSTQLGPVINDLKAHNLDSIMLNGLYADAANAYLTVSDQLNFNTLFPLASDLNSDWWFSSVAPTIENARSIIYPMVDAIKNHASLKGYYIADEPSYDLMDKLTLAVQAFRERDPSRPAFPILIGVDRVGPLFDASQPNVMVIDVYPVGYDNPPCDFTMTGFGYYYLDFVSYIRQAVQTKPTNTPLWIILQAHQFGNGGAYSLRQPTKEEIRAQHWMAIGEGAHGIFWFIYGSQQGWIGLKDNPVLFNEVSSLADRTKPIRNILVGLHKTTDLFTVSGHPNSYISTLTNQDGTKYYAVADNRSDCSQSQNLSIGSASLDGRLKDLETRQVYSLGSAISFPPGDGKIFELVSADYQPNTDFLPFVKR